MSYFTHMFINIYRIVSNIARFISCEFIKTIGNIFRALLCLKKNEISIALVEHTDSKNRENCKNINLKKKYITTQKRTLKRLNNINTHNTYVDVDDDCDWGWFVAIDNCNVYGK